MNVTYITLFKIIWLFGESNENVIMYMNTFAEYKPLYMIVL